MFMDVYAPNGGADRLRFFNILKNELLKISQVCFIIFGGDFKLHM